MVKKSFFWGGLAVLLVVFSGGVPVKAQQTSGFEPPQVSNSGACNSTNIPGFAQATAEQQAKFAAARCIRLKIIKTDTGTVCAGTPIPSYVGRGVFDQLPALNFGDLSAEQADGFEYPVDLCPTGHVCTFCTAAASSTTPPPSAIAPEVTPTPSGDTTPSVVPTLVPDTSPPPSATVSPSKSATSSGELPETGWVENVLLFSLLGLTIMGVSGYVYLKRIR